MDSISARPLEVSLGFGLLAIVALFLFRNPLSDKAVAKYPILRGDLGSYQKRELEYSRNARNLYSEGYQKFKSAIYRLTTADNVKLILPMRYLDELRQRPDDEVSINDALVQTLESSHTKLSPENPLINHSVRADLTPKLGHLNPRLGEEAKKVMETELPPCDDWTPVQMQTKLLRMVAIMSGNIFLGPELCRREEYIHASINYTVDLFESIRLLKQWKKALRWIAASSYFTPEVKRIADHHRRAEEFLVPVIRERKEMIRKGEELPDDMLQWMIEKETKFGKPDDAKMAHNQLALSMAAIHTTTTTLLNILYDVVAVPGLIDELRDEVRRVLAEHDGVVTTKTLYDMKLIDSVMKESQRLNPLGFARFTRVVKKPITLRDGTFIPANTTIEIPHDAITRDPELYPGPDKFDPYRYYNLRQAGEQHLNRHQFVTVTKENINFGWGRHACPGRFFAANEIKLILANLLLDFDIKMKDEDAEMGRIPNFESGNMSVPNPFKELLLRRIKA